MSLLDSILASIANPAQRGSNNDLQDLINLGGTLSQTQGQQAGIQPILEVLGKHTKSALNEQRQAEGDQAVNETVTAISEGSPDVHSIQGLYGERRFDSMLSEIGSKTGLNSQAILSILPMVLPVLMRLLSSGAPATPATPGASIPATPQPAAPQTAGAAAQPGSNQVLNQFLDSDGDGDVDMTDLFNTASRLFGR
jgi:hypothetical protein